MGWPGPARRVTPVNVRRTFKKGAAAPPSRATPISTTYICPAAPNRRKSARLPAPRRRSSGLPSVGREPEKHRLTALPQRQRRSAGNQALSRLTTGRATRFQWKGIKESESLTGSAETGLSYLWQARQESVERLKRPSQVRAEGVERDRRARDRPRAPRRGACTRGPVQALHRRLRRRSIEAGRGSRRRAGKRPFPLGRAPGPNGLY